MEEMKTRQEEAVRAREKLLARKNREELHLMQKEERAKEDKRKKQKQQIKKLSFDPDDDEEEEEDEQEEGDAEAGPSVSVDRVFKRPPEHINARITRAYFILIGS